jgi:hypothetical protein
VSSDFTGEKIQTPRFFRIILVCSQEHIKNLPFVQLSYLVRSQIWLNHFLDDCHFDYIIKESQPVGGDQRHVRMWQLLKAKSSRWRYYESSCRQEYWMIQQRDYTCT